jgi:hypothetical protein
LVEQGLINSHILKKLVESPPSDIDLFSEKLSQELSKIQNAHTHTTTQKPENKSWWTPKLNKMRQQLSIHPTSTTQERIDFNKLRLEYKRQIKITKEASLRVHLDNMEEPEIYRWLSLSDSFTAITTPIQDTPNNTCTTPTDINKEIMDAHYPAYYDIPLPSLTFDLPANSEVKTSDISTARMDVSQTAPGLDNFPYKLLYFLHLNYPTILPDPIRSHLVQHLFPKNGKLPMEYFQRSQRRILAYQLGRLISFVGLKVLPNHFSFINSF